MAVIVSLENDLMNIFGQDIKYLINDFISSFWRARILTSPEQFANYERKHPIVAFPFIGKGTKRGREHTPINVEY